MRHRVVPKIAFHAFEEGELAGQEREITVVWSDTELEVAKPFDLLLDGTQDFRARRLGPAQSGLRAGGAVLGSIVPALDFVRDAETAELDHTTKVAEQQAAIEAKAQGAELERARRLADPTSAESHVLRGNVAFASRDYKVAEAELDAAVRVVRNSSPDGLDGGGLGAAPWQVYCNRSAVRLRIDKTALALRDASLAIKLLPVVHEGGVSEGSGALAYYRQGQAYAQLEQYELAKRSTNIAAQMLKQSRRRRSRHNGKGSSADEQEEVAQSEQQREALSKRVGSLAQKVQKAMQKAARQETKAAALLREGADGVALTIPRPPPPPLLLTVEGWRVGHPKDVDPAGSRNMVTLYTMRAHCADGLELRRECRYSELERIHRWVCHRGRCLDVAYSCMVKRPYKHLHLHQIILLLWMIPSRCIVLNGIMVDGCVNMQSQNSGRAYASHRSGQRHLRRAVP